MSLAHQNLLLRKVRLWFGLTLFAVFLLAPIFTTYTVFAVDSTAGSKETVAKKFAYKALINAQCLSPSSSSSYTSGILSAKDLKAFKWYDGSAKKECTNYFQALGLSPETLVCGTKKAEGLFRLAGNNLNATCSDALRDDTAKFSLKSGSTRELFKKLVTAESFNSQVPGGSLDNYTKLEEYLLHFDLFFKHCASPTPNDEKVGWKVDIFNPTTKKFETKYYSKTKNSTAPLYGKETIECDKLYNTINSQQNKEAYKNEVIANPSSAVDSSSSAPPDQGKKDPCFQTAESLGWWICPVLKKIGDTLEVIYTNAVTPFLSIDSDTMSSRGATHSAWQVVIGFANLMVVIFLLFVIFSQVTGAGLNNLGIKRALPKIIAAAILVNASFLICQLAVDVSNIVGNSLHSLLSNIEVKSSTGIPTDADSAAWFKAVFTSLSGGLVILGGASVYSAFAAQNVMLGIIIPVLLAFLFALVAVFFFFVLLGLRRAGVIILVALSPVAFVCYMLPNTKKWFDKWLKMLEGLLLLYPICGLLIGGGHLASKIILADATDFMTYFIGASLLVAPYFFIPTLLKGSFSAMGNVGAKISGFGQKFGRSAVGRADRGIQNTEWAKRQQEVSARRRQELGAKRTIRGLNRKNKILGAITGNKNRQLSDRDTRFMAKSQETLRKLSDQDQTARTILTEKEFENTTMPELEEAWNAAYDAGDTERLDALTNVMMSKYGTAGAKAIGNSLANKKIVQGHNQDGSQIVNENAVKSLRALQNNLNHNSTFANHMKNKASDAYAMISDAGLVRTSAGKNEYRNLDHFSKHNPISSDLKDWSTQSGSTLQRALESGALTPDMAEKLLTSTDPNIQSGIQSDKSKYEVLQAYSYKTNHAPELDLTAPGAVEKAAKQYQSIRKSTEESAERATLRARESADSDRRQIAEDLSAIRTNLGSASPSSNQTNPSDNPAPFKIQRNPDGSVIMPEAPTPSQDSNKSTKQSPPPPPSDTNIPNS